tara:strand:+ start:28 stop:1116 length:1089 start_codon:yes stop_codon:yes gene_type:complete
MKNKKKVLFVQPILPHYRIPFFENFNKIYELDLFAEHNRKQKYSFGIKYSENLNFLTLFTWQKNLLKINFKEYDLVIFNVNPKYLSTIIALIICKLKSVKTIDYNHRRSSTSKSFFIIIRNLIVKILTNGRIYYTKAEFEEEINSNNIKLLSPVNLGYANNSIDTKLISNFRKEYIPNKRFDFLFVGRLTSKANIQLIIKALVFSKKNYKVNILGDSKSNSKIFKNLADKYNVGERIIWHTFSSNESVISNLFNNCRCFVYPGEVGLSIIHAMSYGLPAIIHNNRIHHNPEHSAFTDKLNGFYFEENDERSLSIMMDKLYSSSDKELELYSKNSLKIINKDFSIDKMVMNFHAVIRNNLKIS